jgi:hypothetical protein
VLSARRSAAGLTSAEHVASVGSTDPGASVLKCPEPGGTVVVVLVVDGAVVVVVVVVVFALVVVDDAVVVVVADGVAAVVGIVLMATSLEAGLVGSACAGGTVIVPSGSGMRVAAMKFPLAGPSTRSKAADDLDVGCARVAVGANHPTVVKAAAATIPASIRGRGSRARRQRSPCPRLVSTDDYRHRRRPA